MGQPTPNDYHNPGRRPPAFDPKQERREFVAGVAIGTVVSAVLWLGGPATSRFVPARVIFGLAYVVVPLTKFVLGVSMLSRPPWKSFGAGLLVSLAVGFLIFFGVCWAAMTP